MNVRPRGRKDPRNLLLLLPAFAMIGAIWAGSDWALHELQLARCPAGTFLASSSRVAGLFAFLPPFMPAIALGLLATNWFAHAIPPLRRFFETGALRGGQPAYGASQRMLAKLCAVLFAVALPVSLGGTFSQFCLADEAILYQPRPWSALNRYEWRDVTSVSTACYPSRSGWTASYVLALNDGNAFDIMGWEPATVRAYPDLSRALHGLPFSFDASGVERGCGVLFKGMLTHRP